MPPQRKFSAKVLTVEEYGEKVRKFSFLPDQRIPRYKSGQFLHLAIDKYDPSSNWPDSRAFSIASAMESKTLDIIVSRKGDFTKKMFQLIKPGSRVWIRMPFGNFNLENIGNSVVLIAGGTGISPFIPFLKAITSSIDLNVFYGVLNEKLLIIDKLLQDLDKRTNINLNLYLEEGHFRSTRVNKGIIDLNKAVELAKTNNSSIYVSGPPALISETLQIALKKGISVTRVIFDEWQ